MTDTNIKQKRITAMKTSVLFRTCNEALLQEVEPELTDICLEKDQVLFREGDPGDALYIVISGKLGVYTSDKNGNKILIDEKPTGSCVGEIAMLTGQLRTASVYAIEKSTLLCLSKEGFNFLGRRHPGLVAVVSSAIVPNLQMGYLARVLADLFGEIDMTQLQDLQSQMEWLTLEKSDVLFRKGDPGDGMYIVVTGRLQIFVIDDNGQEHLHSEAGPGEIVGEIALITQEKRSATIYAIRETNVVKLPTTVFEQLINKYPKLMIEITRMIMRRQEQMLVGNVHKSRSYNYVIVPLSKNLSLQDLLVQLGLEMTFFGNTLVLDAHRFDQIYGYVTASQTTQEDPLSFVINKCLTDLAARYKYLIYVADYGWTPWTQRVVSQADRVLLVASAKDSAEIREVEEIIRNRYDKVRVELILLHPAETKQPSNTTAWLNDRKVFAHHHLRQQDRKHIRRLTRHLTNNKIGLVLSGGGARGLAHIGVIKALCELGIEFDVIAGTSMGSLIAGVYAAKLSPEALVELAEKFASAKQLFDFTLPIVSLMSSNKLTHVIEEMFGDVLIEDLWQQYFCISSNLSRAVPIVHRQGLLRRAVRASVSIPTVFSPVVFDGDVVVDGGIMNNFPVDIMRDLCEEGTVIGITVALTCDKVPTFTHDDSVSGWKILINRLNPMSEKEAIPSMVWTIMRSMEVNNIHLQNKMDKLTDLLIHPEVSNFGMLDFGSFEPIIDIGYKAALPKLKEWKPKYLKRYGN